MTEHEYLIRMRELQDKIEELEEELARITRDYLDLEHYCERLEQGDV